MALSAASRAGYDTLGCVGRGGLPGAGLPRRTDRGARFPNRSSVPDHLDRQLAHYSDKMRPPFFYDLLRKTRSAPEVRPAALASNVPMAGYDDIDIVVEGFEPPGGKKTPPGLGAIVSDGYFITMGIPILSGRGFLESDRKRRPGGCVERDRGETLLAQGNAVGSHFRLRTATGPAIEVVGVARASKVMWIAEPP
jgi:hypothetical protein